jgi:hypothetical protein
LGEDEAGFAPSATFGQWVSALARMYAIRPDPPTRDKVLRLNRLYAKTISGDYYDKNRFPTYCYDKLVCGLIDSHRYVGDPDAPSILERTTNIALPHFPEHAVEHGKEWGPNKDQSWTWDESYTVRPARIVCDHGHSTVITRPDLLAAKRMDQRRWQVKTAGAPIKMLPFTDIGEEQYSTYMHVT